MDFDVHLTMALQRKILRKRIFKRWPRLLGGTVLLLIGISLNPWLQTFGFTLLGVLFAIHAAAYFRGCRSIRRWHAVQGDDPIHYHVDEELIRATSNLGSVELKWAVFQGFHDAGDFYALRYLNGGHLTLPSADVPAEALAFIQEKFQMLGLPTSGGAA